MSTTYVVVPPPGPTSDNTDFAKAIALAQPTTPFEATIRSVPELFTPLAQQTTGTARMSG